jgi:hypothetical protein
LFPFTTLHRTSPSHKKAFTALALLPMDIPASKLTSDLSSGLSAVMSSNSNQMNPALHPLEAISAGIQGAMSGETRAPRASHMMSANEGPADIIGKVSGTVKGGKRADDGLYFTNNEAIPFPDPYE